jgi:hypothetical protein
VRLASQHTGKGKGKAREDVIDLTSELESAGKLVHLSNGGLYINEGSR